MNDQPDAIRLDAHYAVWWCKDDAGSIAEAFERIASWLRRQHEKGGIGEVVSISYDDDPEFTEDGYELTGENVGCVFLVYLPSSDDV